MRLLGLIITVFLLAHPASASAQSVKLADLVGTWVGKRTDIAKATNDTLVLQADSTYKWTGKKQFERWHHLTGDTLSLGGGPGFILALQDQQLSMIAVGTGGSWVFSRADAPAPKP